MATNFQYSPNDLVSLAVNPQSRSQAEQYLSSTFGRIAPQASERTYTLRGMTSSDDNGTLINQTPYYTDQNISSWYGTGDWTAGREGRFAGTQAPTADFMAIMSGQGDEFSPGFQTTGYTVDLTPDFRDERGYGRYVGNYDAQGNLTGITFQSRNLSQGWLGDNMDVWGPLLVGGAAMLGAGAAAGAAGGGAAAGGTAAPISASTPSWVAGMPTTAGASLEAGLAGVGSTWAGGAAGGTTAASTGGIGSFLSGLGNKITQNPLGYLSAGLNAYSQYRQGDYQQDAADQQMQNRQGFIDRLNSTYTNPESVLQGPEYQSLLNVISNKLQRSDAARGRLANDAERQKLMMDHAAAYLDNYRRGLTSAMSGSPIGSDMIRAGTAGAADQMGLFNSLLSMAGRDMAPKPAYNFSPQSGYVFNLGDV